MPSVNQISFVVSFCALFACSAALAQSISESEMRMQDLKEINAHGVGVCYSGELTFEDAMKLARSITEEVEKSKLPLDEAKEIVAPALDCLSAVQVSQ